MESAKKHIKINNDVQQALNNKVPVVALESTIIAHGMPYPQNITFAKQAERIVAENGCVPATIAIIDGVIHVGLSESKLEHITSNKIEKVALRDIGYVVSKNLSGATTVSATMHIAHLVGIKVFATGGIGGVHRIAEQTFDISQDLLALSRTPIIVVSAGAKAILDIPKTLEHLETFAIPIVGYQTNEFPAFYSRISGCKLSVRCDTPQEIVKIYEAQKELQVNSALLVANPVPVESEIPAELVDNYINSALTECYEKEITGKAVTPFLLKRIVELSDGKSLKTNISLALNNVKLASEIAKNL